MPFSENIGHMFNRPSAEESAAMGYIVQKYNKTPIGSLVEKLQTRGTKSQFITELADLVKKHNNILIFHNMKPICKGILKGQGNFSMY